MSIVFKIILINIFLILINHSYSFDTNLSNSNNTFDFYDFGNFKFENYVFPFFSLLLELMVTGVFVSFGLFLLYDLILNLWEKRLSIFSKSFDALLDCLKFGIKSFIVCLSLYFGVLVLMTTFSQFLPNNSQDFKKNAGLFTFKPYNVEKLEFTTNSINTPFPISNKNNNLINSNHFDNIYTYQNSTFSEPSLLPTQTIPTIIKNFLQSNTKSKQQDHLHNTHNTHDSNNNHNHIKINPTKKNLVVFKFDDLFGSNSGDNKFQNVNNFVNLVIESFKHHKNNTEVAIILTSGGGNALLFERAHANLERLKNHGFKTYAVIDTICASGCYMMACACDKIIAGNSSSIGSIGVYTKRYNGEKLSKMIGVEELTFKTSDKKGDIPFLGHADEASLQHIQDTIDRTMRKFSSIVKKGRPNADSKYFDADVWYAEEALEYDLIDKIQMVDDFLMEKEKTHNIIFVTESPVSNNKNSNSDIYESTTRILNIVANKLEKFDEI